MAHGVSSPAHMLHTCTEHSLESSSLAGCGAAFRLTSSGWKRLKIQTDAECSVDGAAAAQQAEQVSA